MNAIDYSKYEGHGLTGATIEPLNGKYYGTIITSPDGSLMKIWGWNRQYAPSHRELSDWEDEDEPFEICDSHYEDVGDLATATLITDAPDLLAACRERDKEIARLRDALVNSDVKIVYLLSDIAVSKARWEMQHRANVAVLADTEEGS